LSQEESWFDCGSPEGMLSAGATVRDLMTGGRGYPGYIEKAALDRSFITEDQFRQLCDQMPSSAYRDNLLRR